LAVNPARYRGRVVKARELLAYLGRVTAVGGRWLYSAVGFVFLVVGGSLAAVTGAALHEPLGAAALLILVILVTGAVGAFRVHGEEENRTKLLTAQLRALEEKPPRLSFGKPVVPRHSQPIPIESTSSVGSPSWRGRVIRVPVINAQGAGEANRVHARLSFLPGEHDARLAPRYPGSGRVV
jgi:hypothetical protein